MFGRRLTCAPDVLQQLRSTQTRHFYSGKALLLVRRFLDRFHADIFVHLALSLILIPAPAIKLPTKTPHTNGGLSLVAAGRDDTLLGRRVHVSLGGVVKNCTDILPLQATDGALYRIARGTAAKVLENRVTHDDVEGETVAQERSVTIRVTR